MHFSRPGNIPAPTVRRLSLYLRQLQSLEQEEIKTVSSRQLGQSLQLTDVQVRKDLAHFGTFGHPGVGYNVQELVHRLRRALGTDQEWAVALVGVGNLGRALLSFGGFAARGLRIVAAFDADPAKIGTAINGLTVLPIDRLRDDLATTGCRLAMLTVPPDQAQDAANRLVEAGIEGILNFSPVALNLPRHVALQAVDLAAQLEQLTFQVNLNIANREKE